MSARLYVGRDYSKDGGGVIVMSSFRRARAFMGYSRTQFIHVTYCAFFYKPFGKKKRYIACPDLVSEKKRFIGPN